jgi:hypothetical protein
MPLPVFTSPLVVSVFLDQPILAVIYLITIAVSLWLFRDALRRGKSIFVAAGWAIGVLIVPPIAFFAYLYLRLKTEGSMTEPPISDRD